MTRFIKTIAITSSAANAGQYGRIDLATIDKNKFLNLITTAQSLTISPAEAKKLRDALIEAYPIEPVSSKFAVGARVVYTNNVGYGIRGMAGRKGTVLTVLTDEWYEVVFTGGPFDNKLKVHSSFLTPDNVTSVNVPTSFTEPTGRYIVVNLDGAKYLPSSTPYIHTNSAAAEAEAQRLARVHGGTFHVLRASFEASREKPVIPPVKTTKL